MTCSLVALEIAIKEAPQRSWTSPLVDGLLALSFVTGAAFVRRTLRSPWPLVDLRTFRDRNFAVGCLLSFVLGIGLFGSVYLMPVFLAYVRGHGAFEVGMIILVTGVVQFSDRSDRGRARAALRRALFDGIRISRFRHRLGDELHPDQRHGL